MEDNNEAKTGEIVPAERDATTGRFLEGNKISNRPSQLQALREEFINAVHTEDFHPIVRALVKKAKAGSFNHIKLFLEYTIGKPELTLHHVQSSDTQGAVDAFFKAMGITAGGEDAPSE